MIVYAEFVFLICLIMNTLIFWVSSKINELKVSIFRVILGGLISALLATILIAFSSLGHIYNFIIAILILIVGLLVVFGKIKIKKFMYIIFFTHITAFSSAGIALFLRNFIYTNDLMFDILLTNLVTIVVASICIYIVCKYRYSLRHSFCSVKIFFDGKTVEIKTLIDTGNLLIDPMSKKPVIIAELSSISILIRHEENPNTLKLSDELIAIPFQSIGEIGYMAGFNPDKVLIKDENDCFYEVNEVVIGISKLKLSPKGDYQGLINPSLFRS